MKGAPAPEPKCPTVAEALTTAAASSHGLIFMDLRERDVFLPWSELHRRARLVAGALLELGVRAGDRVAIILPTAPSFSDALFGAVLAGAVPVPLYPPVCVGRMEEYQATTGRMLAQVTPRILLTDSRIRMVLGRAVQQTWPPLGLRTTEELREQSPGEADAAVEPDAVGVIQFSSGSTAAPKPVALTHRNLMCQCAVLQALMPEPPQQMVSCLPLYQGMGLIGCLLSATCYPGRLALLPPEVFLLRPALWLRAISRMRGTLSPAPSSAYALCLNRVTDEEMEGVDLSSWRYAPNGAEPASMEVLERFAQRFARWGFDPHALMPLYALSESLAVSSPPRRASPRALGVDPLALAILGTAVEGKRRMPSAGAPVPGVEVEIRDEQHQPCPDRKVGRIHVRGPSVMAEYFRNLEATERVLSGGWLDTGDLGFSDEGELYVCGRAEDVIKLDGANHQPLEFEECVEELEGMRPGCAVALGFTPAGEDGKRLLVLVEVKAPEQAGLEERIREALLARTQVRAHTVKLLAPGTLPRTSSGKKRRSEALRRFSAGELHPPAPASARRRAEGAAQPAAADAKVKLDGFDI